MSIKNIFIVLLLLMVGAVQAASPRDPNKFFFNETWGNYPEEIAKAKAEGKKGILFFFEQADCPFCHYMKVNVLNQPEVQKYYRANFLIFPMDIEGDVEITTPAGKQMKEKQFAFQNRVRATPVFLFYDLNGKVTHRLTGKTADVKEFMWVGQFVVDGYYKKMKYMKFKQKKRRESE